MRKAYIDNIRWITVVLVVIYHVIYMFNGVTTYGVMGPISDLGLQDIYLYIVYPWFMFLLFVVSGMSARFELDSKGQAGFIRKRTRKYLVPSTLGLIVFWWILGYYNMLISDAFTSMSAVPQPVLFLVMCVSGTGPLWYIQLLWFFSVILIAVRKVENDRLYKLGEKMKAPALILMVLPVYLSAQILNTPIVVVYRFGIYGFGFLLGYFIFSHDEVMARIERYWLLFTILGAISGIIYVIKFQGESYPDHYVLDTFICNCYAWFGAVGILAFMKKWGNFQNRFSSWMNRKTWGIYVFHYLGIAVSAWYLRMYLPEIPAIITYLLVTVSGFAVALILNEVISRIPFFRWCILGITNK